MRWLDFTVRNPLWPLLLTGALGCGSGAPPISGRIEQETLASAIVHDSYLILVRLPPAYDSSPTQNYPVAYQLDATSFGPEFDITAGLASDLEAKGTIGSTIIVGIGYPYNDPLIGGQAGRSRDYVTTRDNGMPGGAASFLRFIREELIPHIDAKYRTQTTGRTLLGHSLGGFFTLYTMFQTGNDPARPFSRLVAGDPSITEDNLRLFDEEQALASTTRSLPNRMYLPTARYDGAVQTLYSDALASRLATDFPNLQVAHRVYDTDHGGVIAPGFSDGLAFVLGGAP